MDDRELNEMSYEDMERLIENMVSYRISHSSEQLEQPKFHIIKTYMTLGENSKEKTIFAKVHWRNYERYDLRKWSKDLSVPFKGISFSLEELKKFPEIKKNPSSESEDFLAVYSGGKAKATIYYNLLTLSESTFKQIRWIKQINVIDWGYGKKVDFRKWTPDYQKCSKGICLSWDVFTKFYNIVLSILREGM